MKKSNMTFICFLFTFFLFLTPPLHSQQTEGYILSGWTRSYSHGAGDDDFLLYRIDAAGNKVWRKNYGGTENDFGYGVAEIVQ